MCLEHTCYRGCEFLLPLHPGWDFFLFPAASWPGLCLRWRCLFAPWCRCAHGGNLFSRFNYVTIPSHDNRITIKTVKNNTITKVCCQTMKVEHVPKTKMGICSLSWQSSTLHLASACWLSVLPPYSHVAQLVLSICRHRFSSHLIPHLAYIFKSPIKHL